MAAYGMSKAAALIATMKFAMKLKQEGFVVVSLNPGLVDVSGTNGASGEMTRTRRVYDTEGDFREQETLRIKRRLRRRPRGGRGSSALRSP